MSRGASVSTFPRIKGGKDTERGINARAGWGKSSVNNARAAQGHMLLFFNSIPGKYDPVLQKNLTRRYIFHNLLSILVTGVDNAIWCGYHILIRVLVIMPTHHY